MVGILLLGNRFWGRLGLDGLLLMVVLGDGELGARWILGCGAQIR